MSKSTQPLRCLRGIIVSLLVSFAALPAVAQQIVYEPINPSFGGDSFNSSHLLGVASAQNDYTDPSRATSQNSQTDLFLRQLQSRLLSSLASQVSDAICGDNPQDNGTVVFGDQVIEFNRGLESVQLVITDNSTGSRTEIEIPILLTSSGAPATTTGQGSDLGALLSGTMPTDASTTALLSGDF